MLSIFKKRTFLVDLLEGITDFHNHLLPGIDDGAKNTEDSIAMIEKFGDFGIKNFVCSPHIMGDYYPNTPETIHDALKKLKNEIKSDVSLTAAAEYMMDQDFQDILKNDDLLVVSGKKVLVEMSYFQPPINLNEILFKLQNKKYHPILAHPERYPFYHKPDLADYKDLKSRGCTFQLNMLSLMGHYGISIQKIAFKLLEAGMFDYIGSDTHRLEHLEKLSQIRISKKHLEPIQKLIENNKSMFN